METEIWVDCCEALDKYEVSTLGNFRHKRIVNLNSPKKFKKPKQNLKGFKTPKGYITYTIKYNGKKINFNAHRLIYYSFYPDTNRDLIIHHKDGNKSNNRLDNLEPMPNPDHVSMHHRKLQTIVADSITKKIIYILKGINELKEFCTINKIARETIKKYSNTGISHKNFLFKELPINIPINFNDKIFK